MDEDSRHGTIWVEHIPEVKETKLVDAGQEDTLISVAADKVTHFQTARKYLIDNHGFTASEIPNQEAVLAAAKSKNIVFPGWNPKSSHA